MCKKFKSKNASSIVEYMMVVLFVFSTIFVFQPYIIRAFSGRWKTVGDSFGSGKQYDPKSVAQGGTLECFYYRPEARWVATQCWERCVRGQGGDPCAPPAGLGLGDPGKEFCCRNHCDTTHVQYAPCRDSAFSI